MERNFIPYEIALDIELGFNEPCFGMYIEDKSW